MQVHRFLNRDSTIYRVPEIDGDSELDDYGNPLNGDPVPETGVDCYFAPWSAEVTATDRTVDRATTTDEWLYIVAPGTSLASIDHIEIDGETGTFEVVGEPNNEWNPLTAGAAYVAARLRRTRR